MMENYNSPAFEKVNWDMVTKVETSNGRNCRGCSKSNVCEYQEIVVEEVEKLIGQVEKLNLPLSININCREWDSEVNVR